MQFHVCLIDSPPRQWDFQWQVKQEVVTRLECFYLHELSKGNSSKHSILLPVDRRRLDSHRLIRDTNLFRNM